MALFMDPLDIWLTTMGGVLLALAYWLYLNYLSKAQIDERIAVNRAFGVFLIIYGIYAMASGLWATFTWPFPGPYNILFSDAWPFFGVAALVLGLINYLKEFAAPEGKTLHYIRGALIGVAAVSLPPLLYGLDIWMYGLTKEPEIAGLMFVLIGLAGLLSPLLTVRRTQRGIAILLLIFIAVAALIALFIGVSAAFAHVPAWSKWSPWYGVVK